MRGQILKIGIVDDIIGNMAGRSSARVQSFLYIPELGVAVTEFGGELFVLDDFTPHKKTTPVMDVEVSGELNALIQIWATSQKAVKQALTTQAPFDEHFLAVRRVTERT